MTYFCKECGSSTESSISIPKFCSTCATPFNSNSSSAPRQTQKPSKPIPSFTTNSEDIELEEEPSRVRVDKYKIQESIEIVGDEPVGMKFESIAKQKPMGTSRPPQKLPKRKKDRTKLVQDYMAETKAKDLNNIEVLGTPGED
jgi:hypothetical protein